MENITLGQLANTLAWIISLGVSVGTIMVFLKKNVNKLLEPLYGNLRQLDTNLNKSIQNLDMNQCKNFLVRFLADVERGQKMDDIEVKRAYDSYDHYTKELGGNSYIHDKWHKLMKERKK